MSESLCQRGRRDINYGQTDCKEGNPQRGREFRSPGHPLGGHNVAPCRPGPGFLTDVLLELTTELSIKILGQWVVSKKRNRCILPCQRPRAGEIARAS
jgi:hypothetical protein